MIANNFHRQIDLTPNICAVYVEPRARALIGHACAELSAAGWERVYLITGHDCFLRAFRMEVLRNGGRK